MDFSNNNKFGDIPSLNRSRIYNFATNKKPAELFRKDLISAMKLSDSEQLNKDDYWLIMDIWKTEWEKGVQVPLSSLDGLHSNKLKYKKLDLNEKNDYKIPKNLIEFEMNPDFYVSNYDLDLVDLCWLDSLKESEESILISEDVLASVITQFELQCAAKMNAEKEKGGCDDHVLCDVCKSPDGEDNNEMVFCDSCNICVHQGCYGIQSIPSGEWHCSPCKELGSKKNVVCVLCPNIGGAFKPTSNAGQWSHVSCALWIPEIIIGDVELMEPIMQIDQIPAARWNLLCSLCSIKQGTPIQCSEKGCKVAYHVTCAFNHKLKMKAILEKNKTGVKLKSFCRKHSEEKQKEENNNKKFTTLSIPLSSSSLSNEINNLNHNTSVNSIVQEIDLVINSESSLENSNLEFWQYVDVNSESTLAKELLKTIKDGYPTLSFKTHQLYLDLMYQYWKIKRYSQFGAPLIKITTSSSFEEMQLKQRIEVLRLRVDLERIRNLSYMLIKREKLKKTWLNAHKNLIDKSLEIGERINSVNTLKILKNIYRPESPTQNSEFQHHLRILENLNTIHDTIDINNIYDHTSNELNRVKLILKRLNRLTKIEKTNEFLNSRIPKPNPYARSYLIKRDEDSDSYSSDHIKTSASSNSSSNGSSKNNNIKPIAVNSNHHHNHSMKATSNNNSAANSPKSYPLKSKSIPSNLKNSSHHLKQSSDGVNHLIVHEIKYNNNSNSKLLYESPNKTVSSLKKNHHLVKANSVSRVCKKLRSSSPKLLSRLVKTDVKSSRKTQENLITRRSVKKLNFNNLELLPNSKKHHQSSSNSINRKIPTRSHFNHANNSIRLQKL